MLLIIQEIKLKWTKQSRGAPNATRRNAVPSTLSLSNFTPPKSTVTSPHILHHQTVFDEAQNFDPHETLNIHEVDPPNRHFKFGCLHPHFSPQMVEISFDYTSSCGGAPDRSAPAQTVLKLQSNEWGQIIYNGRFSLGYSGDWYYQQFTFKIALLDEWASEHRAIFTDTTPIKTYKNMADLR